MLKSLIEKFKEHNIEAIISIDDDWEKKEIETNISLKEFLNENSLWDSSYDSIFEDIEDKYDIKENDILVKDVIENQYQELEVIEEIVTEHTTNNKSSSSLSYITDLVSKLNETISIDFIKLKSISEITEENIPKKNCLIYVDKELEKIEGSSEEYEDSVLNIIRKIQAINSDFLNFFLVYSHTNLKELENHTEKKQYLQNDYLKINNYETLPKEKTFDAFQNIYLLHGFKKNKTNLDDFLSETNEKLDIAIYGKCIQDIFDAKRDIELHTYEDIYSRELKDYEMLYQDAFFEGESPVNVIKKLVKGIKKDKNQEKLNLHIDKYKRYSKEIYKKINVYNKKIEDSESPKAYNENEIAFRTSKINLATKTEKISNTIFDKNVNTIFSDITKGDLFLINKNTFGVVISKECDSVIRKNDSSIERKNNKFKLLILNELEITPLKKYKKLDDKINKVILTEFEKNYVHKGTTLKSSKSKIITNLKKTQDTFNKMFEERSTLEPIHKKLLNKFNDYIWPIYIDDSYYALGGTKQIIEIDSNLLDLCTLNDTGKSLINYDDSYQDFKSYYSKKYFENFLDNKFYKTNQETESLFSNFLKEEIDFKEKKLILSSIKNEINILKNEKIIGFDIKRLGRLQSQRTLYLLQTYLNDFIKPGVETALSFS